MKSPRAHLHPLKELVFSLDDEAFHASDPLFFEPEYVKLVFSNDLYVSKYISDRLRYLRVSCVSSLIPLNEAAVELTSQSVGAQSQADWLLCLVDSCVGLEMLILEAHAFDVPQDRLVYYFENDVCLRHFELLPPTGRIHIRVGVQRLLAKLSTLCTLRLDHVIDRRDAKTLVQSTEWQGLTVLSGLEILNCRMELTAAEIILPHFRTLHRLDITLYSKPPSLLAQLTSVFTHNADLDELEDLNITLPYDITMLPLEALTRLSAIWRNSKNCVSPAVDQSAAACAWDELTSLVGNWTNLKHLGWASQL